MIAATLKRDWWLLASNAVAMIGCVWANAPGIFEPSTRGFDVGYALLIYLRVQSVQPFLVLACLMNAAWLVFRLRRRPRADLRTMAISLVAVCGGWLGTYVIIWKFG
ncbi:MAG: hypothetical protein KYX67_12745 [Brevundimonas sp.]|uniref:Uncharacterized protein n=1 Tax=Brevundimonas mediterranea TaxID=74329 RepID=A0A7W6A4S7_9CAUL|nr:MULTISPECIES: hypothetical protein [Brevundimonas]MBB3872132.1 hypothetical protein [Brevundimonas mediterranea]MDK2748179.1 hypothetical protein [Brevundimonas sp.]